MLATLNTRQVLRGRGTDNAHQTIPTFVMMPTITNQREQLSHDEDSFAAQGKVGILSLFCGFLP